MKRKLVLIIFIVSSSMMAYCQLKNDSISDSFNNKVSIYEYGDSLSSCETNFSNLFRNWYNGHITNAKEYSEFGKYSFVETISDSARFRYYRNYFSGLETVSHYYSTSGSSYNEGKQWKIKEENFITPYKEKWALLERLPIETMIKMLKLYNTEINIDTIKLKTVSQEIIHTIEEKQDGDSSYHNLSRIREIGIWAYSDSVTKKIIDSMVINQVRFEDLCIQSREAVQISQALLFRVGMQKRFNEAVHIGDKVYVVPFRFGGYQFNVIVICNSISKKVVMDYFFKSIPY